MYKVDFHTHSYGSPDGGITVEQYRKALDQELNFIAITDHNSIEAAQAIQQELGEHIIIGEEIMSTAGEIVGLYLTDTVKAGLSPLETVKQIKEQHGIVYIPHPFETVRKGLHPSVLEELLEHIDVIEVCNGRAFVQNQSAQAVVWAKLNHISGAASSDAHGYHGLGKTYTILDDAPSRENMLQLLSTAKLITERPTVRSLLYPSYHRLRRKLRGHSR